MAKDVIVIGTEIIRPSYVNGKVVKIHEEDIYDIRLPNGQVEAYVENVSTRSYNSGDYVAVLIIGSGETRSSKIIGRGRRITDSSLIKEVVV